MKWQLLEILHDKQKKSLSERGGNGVFFRSQRQTSGSAGKALDFDNNEIVRMSGWQPEVVAAAEPGGVLRYTTLKLGKPFVVPLEILLCSKTCNQSLREVAFRLTLRLVRLDLGPDICVISSQ